jgi:hypothetical protein
MTINWIASAEYRVNEGAWIAFAAADGEYDEAIEPLALTVAGLVAGDYTIDVRAITSVDNPSVPLRFEFHSAFAVPEPGAIAMVAMAAGTLTWRARRRRLRATT